MASHTFKVEVSADKTLCRLESQTTLFAHTVSRLALQKVTLSADAVCQNTVNVWRNHSFEPLDPLIAPYLAFSNWQIDFCLGGYDDALMFDERKKADTDILWLDSSRYLNHTSFSEWLEWVKSRLNALRGVTTSPIILATWVQSAEEVGAINSLADSIPAVYFADMQAASTQADVALLDSRSAIMAGTQVSNAAQVVLARKLACHWLPGALLPPIKAVALDLDNTLHAGILGEDGIHGVKLTPGHAELQYYIKSLQQRGIFITLVSRNEYSDVEALFAERGDYPLRWEDFSAVEVSWGDKPAALERIAKTLRIAHDAVLFVDDNPGELARAAMRLPQIHTLYAHPNASQTTRAVHYYPGLWRWKVEEDDSKRILDLKANAERESLAEHVTDTTDYFRSLQINLTFSYDDKSQITRLADLCHKTNQFNLAMRRFNQTEVVEHMDLEDTCVASVQLGDRLSDSGVIAVFIAERHGKELRIEELCISCRALGRQLEDNIILVALRDMPIFKGCQEVAFRVQHGPRNQPALDWLAQQMNKYEHPAPGLHTMPAQQLLDFESEACVILSKG